MPTGDLIYVDSPSPSSFDFKVYKGPAGAMQTIPVLDVQRRRDGGTTIIQLAGGGQIYSPSHLNPGAKPTYTEAGVSVVLTALPAAQPNLGSAPNGPPAAPPVVVTAPAPLVITDAYRDDEGHWILRAGDAAGTLYWFPSPQSSPIYELVQSPLYSSSRTGEFSIFLPAPTEHSPKRSATAKYDGQGELQISCEDKTQCFRRVSENALSVMKVRLTDPYVLVPAPEAQEVEYAFRLAGSQTHILVESPKLRFSYNFQVWMGEPGKMKKLEVANVIRYRDGGTTYINLKNGSTIYSPSAFKTGDTAKYFITKDDKVGFELESLARTPELAQSLGLDPARYAMPEIHTPASGPGRCSAFL